MYPRVTGVISQQGTDQSDAINSTADSLDMPPRVIVACAIAESNLNEHAERWGTWPDVSFGEFQQTVAFAPIGDQSNRPDNIAYVRETLFDWRAALRIAAPQLARYWRQYQDGAECLGRYNWPARGLAGNPNRANCERAWAASADYLTGETPMTDYPSARWKPSPNYVAGRLGTAVTAIVLHGTAGQGAVGWFQNPASQVSAHYVVEQDGTVVQCVREADTAWANGVVTPNSRFYGGTNPNRWTISIEHTRDKTNTSPLTPVQLGASLDLVQDLLNRYGPLTLLTHDEIDVGRVCPGPGFPLAAFQALTPGETEDPAVIADLQVQIAALQAQTADLSAQVAQLQSYSSSLVGDTLTPMAATLDALIAQPPAKPALVAKLVELRASIHDNVGL